MHMLWHLIVHSVKHQQKYTGWWARATPLKNISQLRDDDILNISGKMPNSWQPFTTNQPVYETQYRSAPRMTCVA